MNDGRYQRKARKKSTLDSLFYLFVFSLVVLKLLGEIHISWVIVFLPIWWSLLLGVSFMALGWIYFETVGKILKNSDETFGLLMGFIFLPLYFSGFFYVLNEIFLWVDLPKIPYISVN